MFYCFCGLCQMCIAAFHFRLQLHSSSFVPGNETKNQTLALLHNNQWFRGVAVRKTGDQFSVYRVDLGDVVTVPKNSLRPMPAPFCR